MDFLRLLMVELDNIKESDYIDLSIELNSEDTIVDYAPDYVKKLYTLYRIKEKIVDMMKIEYKNMSASDQQKHSGKLICLNTELDLILGLINLSIRSYFNLWDKHSIYLINKNKWRVVYNDIYPLQGFGSIIKIGPIQF